MRAGFNRVHVAAVVGLAAMLVMPAAGRAQTPPPAATTKAEQAAQPAQTSIIRMLDEIRTALEQGRSVEAEGMLLQLAGTLRRERLAGEAAARPSSGAPEATVRVGGDIPEPRKIRDVKPAYPQAAQAAGVTGIVVMEINVNQAGDVADAKVLRSVPLLDQAAVDAVRQWKYTPTLLNGSPVSVIMTVTVNFTLGEPR